MNSLLLFSNNLFEKLSIDKKQAIFKAKKALLKRFLSKTEVKIASSRTRDSTHQLQFSFGPVFEQIV